MTLCRSIEETNSDSALLETRADEEAIALEHFLKVVKFNVIDISDLDNYNQERHE